MLVIPTGWHRRICRAMLRPYLPGRMKVNHFNAVMHPAILDSARNCACCSLFLGAHLREVWVGGLRVGDGFPEAERFSAHTPGPSPPTFRQRDPQHQPHYPCPSDEHAAIDALRTHQTGPTPFLALHINISRWLLPSI